MLIVKFDNIKVEEKVAKFESKYDFIFPEQYRAFLLKYNGGKTPKAEFHEKNFSADINGFFGFNGDKSFDYDFYVRTHTLKDFLKDGVVPICNTLAGDDVVIGIVGKMKGVIYLIYHDSPKKYIEIADDFKTFIDKCESKEIGHILSIEERTQAAIENGYGNRVSRMIPLWQKEIDKMSNMVQERIILDWN